MQRSPTSVKGWTHSCAPGGQFYPSKAKQTVIGNPAHDLIRLGLSLATAARGSALPGVTTARMMEEMVEGYDHALALGDGDHTPEPNVVRDRAPARAGTPVASFGR